MTQPRARQALAELDDAELVRRALVREPDAFRTIMQRHNQRIVRRAMLDAAVLDEAACIAFGEPQLA